MGYKDASGWDSTEWRAVDRQICSEHATAKMVDIVKYKLSPGRCGMHGCLRLASYDVHGGGEAFFSEHATAEVVNDVDYKFSLHGQKRTRKMTLLRGERVGGNGSQAPMRSTRLFQDTIIRCSGHKKTKYCAQHA